MTSSGALTFSRFKKLPNLGKSISRSISVKIDQESKKTCLYDLHVENQGKIVNFAGWLLPVQYQDAIAASHQHTRTHASLFDVGHMLQTRVSGRDSGDFLESITTADLRGLAFGGSALTVYTNERGGIMDDLIVTKVRDHHFFIVSNAGRRIQDMQLMLKAQADMKSRGKDVNVEFLDPLEQGLIALQGPRAAVTLQSFVKVDLTKLKFMNSLETTIDNRPVRITRCGYTGEDGFELSVQARDARILTEMIMNVPDVKLAGLGARDSLRLEAALCLYGHDLNESITPVEATLQWLIGKRRRAEANFPGAKKILEQIKTGTTRKRVGLTISQGPPARENAIILTAEGEPVGRVTSGGPSPSLGKSIAMGYVRPELMKTGTILLVEIRGKTYKAMVTKMPFVKTHYYNDKDQ